MKKLLVFLCAMSLVFGMVMSASATIIVYTDESAWESAAGYFLVEDFNDSTLNPGITIESDWGGYVSGGEWYDRVSSDPEYDWETLIKFEPEITAFGGTWDLYNPGGPGEDLNVTIALCNKGELVEVGTIANSWEDEFWGFTSSTAFDEVLLTGGENPYGWAETYTLENMKYAPVPEPSTMLLLGFGLMGLALARKRFFRKGR